MREALVAAGGEIVRPVDPNSPEVHLTFRDPVGNVMGIYQQPGLEEAGVRYVFVAFRRATRGKAVL